MSRRPIVIAVLSIAYLAVMVWLWFALLVLLVCNSPDEFGEAIRMLVTPPEWEDELSFWLLLGTPALILVASQLLFILPVVCCKPMRGGRAKSIWLSMSMAALCAAALTGGLYAGVIGLVQLVFDFSREASGSSDYTDALIAVWPWFILLSWIVWTALLIIFARRRQGRGISGRIVGLLLGGTIVEVIVILPLDVMIRRRTDCYCFSGSYFALVLSGWALLWLAGPGALLALTSRRRRAWWEMHCEMCGYKKGPSPGAHCPECGHAWSGASESA